MRSPFFEVPRGFPRERHTADHTITILKENGYDMKLTKLHVALSIGAAIITTSAFAGPGPGTWPPNFPTVVKTKAEAAACCLPKEKVALACKDCKTTNVKGGEDKKGVLAWFAPDSKHNCSGCGGKIALKTPGSGKSGTTGKYTHTCSKCGDESAYTCATHKKA
jgi:hypothetical protein